MAQQSESARLSPDNLDRHPQRLNTLLGRRIAVIEDDSRILETLCMQLHDWGCEVIGGETAGQIIEQSPDQSPHVILADFHLNQGRNGMGEIIALCLHFNRNIPAGLITEDSSADIHDEIQSSGYPLLTKPIAGYRLRALLQTLASQ